MKLRAGKLTLHFFSDIHGPTTSTEQNTDTTAITANILDYEMRGCQIFHKIINIYDFSIILQKILSILSTILNIIF